MARTVFLICVCAHHSNVHMFFPTGGWMLSTAVSVTSVWLISTTTASGSTLVSESVTTAGSLQPSWRPYWEHPSCLCTAPPSLLSTLWTDASSVTTATSPIIWPWTRTVPHCVTFSLLLLEPRCPIKCSQSCVLSSLFCLHWQWSWTDTLFPSTSTSVSLLYTAHLVYVAFNNNVT